MNLWFLFSWVMRTSMIASVLAGLILLVKGILGKRMGVRWQYAIWWLLILKLLLPVTLPSPLSVFNLFNTTAENININPEQTLYDFSASVGDVMNPDNWADPATTIRPELSQNTAIKTFKVQKTFYLAFRLFYMIWLSGLVVLVIFFLTFNIGFALKIKKQQKITAPMLNYLFREYRLKLGISRDLPVIQTGAVTSPALYGFLRPRLLMPVGIEKILDQDELGYIFIHELAHLKRKDLIHNWLLGLLQILHWFNPVLWYAFGRIRLDREIACDTMVLSVISPEERVKYGGTIINLLRNFHKPTRLALLTGVLDSKTRVKKRIKAIANCGKHPYRWSIFAIIVLIITGLMVLTGAKTYERIDASGAKINMRSLNQKVAKIKKNTTIEDVRKIFGWPNSYICEINTYAKENLPSYYVAVYPGLEIEFRYGTVTELRFYKPDYAFKNTIRVGSSMKAVFKVLGKPSKTVTGRSQLEFAPDDGVLFKDIGGIKDYDSYLRTKERIRVIFKDNKVYALYLMINDPFGTVKRVDRVNYPFVNDPRIIGKWQAVDFVQQTKYFEPGKKRWLGGLFLKTLYFSGGGKMLISSSTWTKGLILNKYSKTASHYSIQRIQGQTYMFFEWKSGDYTLRGMQPWYYVLKKIDNHDYKLSDIPRKIDKLNYPFVNDTELIGKWQSVDFVNGVNQFDPEWKFWEGDLYLKNLCFLKNGLTPDRKITWTKGRVLNRKAKTASRYVIKTINGSKYLFFEWKSSDYVYRGMKPSYYVLKKIN